MYIARDKQGNLKKAARSRSSGDIVITDRYPQIQTLGQNDSPYIKTHVLNYAMKGYFEKYSIQEEKLYSQMVKIQPDVVIKMIVSPGVAIQRKPEHDLNQLERKVEIIKKIQFKDSKVYEIDANRPINEVELAIRRIIWENL